MRGFDSEQAQRRLDAMGPADPGWSELTLNEKIEQNPERYFDEARVASYAEATRQIADEKAMRQRIAATALEASKLPSEASL